MVQPWAVERMTEDHLRQLSELRRRSGKKMAPQTFRNGVQVAGALDMRDPTTGRPLIGSYVGSWLIRLGTRLGGLPSEPRRGRERGPLAVAARLGQGEGVTSHDRVRYRSGQLVPVGQTPDSEGEHRGVDVSW